MRIVGAALIAGSPLFAQPTANERDEPDSSEERHALDEVIVVSVSKLQERLVNAPASVSVLPSRTIEMSPAQNYGDLLRVVPGVNVVQLSARDVNLASRAQTGTIVTSQLALLDGRTLYQDFFGFVLWDLIPIGTGEIKQIEVIRGPASAVWGANAMTGVVNLITRTPREMEGTDLTVAFGAFDRSVGDEDRDSGLLFSLHATHARVVNDRLAFKVSAGAFAQHALPRPTGDIPNDSNTPYPSFTNYGTKQPRFDFRLDYDFGEAKPPSSGVADHKLIVAGGLGATSGVIHTGIGPFAIQSDTFLGYGKVNYQRGSLKVNFFTNIIDGSAPSLLTPGIDGEPLDFVFSSRTYDLEVGDFRTIGDRQLLSFGGNYRYNGFDLSFASGADRRTEWGLYLQDEIFFSDKFRWTLGGRIDRFDVVDHAVFSPRTALLFKPSPRHSLRLSFNRAFRAPSFVNSYLDAEFLTSVDVGGPDPFLFPVAGRGNVDLSEESLTAYELSYTGALFGRTILSLALYTNVTENVILFTQTGTYTSSNPPAGWPLPPPVLDWLAADGQGLPSELAYRNFDRVSDRGFEVSVETPVSSTIDVFANYSWQDEPRPTGFDLSELNLPPTHRVNAGLDFRYRRYFGYLVGSFVDDAFWQDVLDARYHGPTRAYTLVSATFGVEWEEGKLATSLKVTNLLNRELQQHVFGDIFKRQIVGELHFRF